MLKPKQIIPLLDEVVVAKNRANSLKGHPDLTLGEQLDVYRGAEQAAANRFDTLAQAYRDLVAETGKELRTFYRICEQYRRKQTIVPVTRYDVHDAAERLGITLSEPE